MPELLPLRCVLLVDDNRITRFLHRRLIVRLGIAEHVLEATNGEEALALVHAQCADDFRTCPDLILLDVRMPVLDGFGFLEEYRALPEAQQCAKVVALLTTSWHPRDKNRAAQWVIADYLIKPLTADQLSALLKDRFVPARLLPLNAPSPNP